MTAAAPFLITDRLALWLPAAADLAGMVALLSHADMQRHLAPGVDDAKAQFERLLRNAGSWALYGYGMLTVRHPGDPAVIGTCGVFRSWRGFGRGMDDVPEAGWIIGRDHWGQGLAQEAMRAVLAWFDAEHEHQRIACMIAQGNAASERVAATLGFAAYDRDVDPGDGAVVTLYERRGPPGTQPGVASGTSPSRSHETSAAPRAPAMNPAPAR